MRLGKFWVGRDVEVTSHEALSHLLTIEGESMEQTETVYSIRW